MIAPQVSFELGMKEHKQVPSIVKKPVSFFNDKEPLKQQAKQQEPSVKQQALGQSPSEPTPQQESEHNDITTELEEMSIGLKGLMEGNVKQTKPKRPLSEKQLANLAKMREKKALKREQTKKLVLPQTLGQSLGQSPRLLSDPSLLREPSAPQQSSKTENQQNHQPAYENLNDIITKEFEKLYSAKESIRQQQKTIRRQEKQKVIDKLIAQQKLNAIAQQVQQPAPQQVVQPQALGQSPSLLREPKPIASTVGKKLRYRMSPYGGGIETYYDD